MPTESIRFNCGEFLPGQAPLSIPGISPPVIPIMIPEPIGPVFPNWPQQPREDWVCVCSKPCNSSIGFPPGAEDQCLSTDDRECVRRSSLPTGTRASLETYPTKLACEAGGFKKAPCYICGIKCTIITSHRCVTDPSKYFIDRECIVCQPSEFGGNGCNFKSMVACQTVCIDEDCPPPSQGQIPPTSGRVPPANPRGPITPGGGGGPVVTPTTPISVPPPITPGGASRYRCSEVKIYCPEDLGLPIQSRRIKQIVRNCAACSQVREPETNRLYWPNDCIYTSKPQCQTACLNSSISMCSVMENETPIGAVLPNTQVEGPIYGSIRPVTVINVIEELYNQTSVVTTPNTNEGSLYHPTYNFFREEPNQNITLVENNSYLEIFNTTVSREVGYLINMASSLTSWSEVPLQNLTNEKIQVSLNPLLLRAFNNIHYPGGLKAEVSIFLEMVKRHLITGTLDDLDYSYYINLAQRQEQDPLIAYGSTTARNYLERAALGLISKGGISADPSNFESIQANQIKRQRRLNEDINARIPVCPINAQSSEMLLSNGGICFVDSSPIPIGPGAGYYIETKTVNGNCVSMEVIQEVSSAYYVPAEVRFNALKLFGEDPGVILTSNSLSALDSFGDAVDSNEFMDGAIPEVELVPLYSKLDLSSVDDSIAINPLISKTTATYSLLMDQDEIDEHTYDNGFAVTRVNVDYKDFFYRYAKDSSSMSLSQNDITFRNFEENIANVDSAIITRNIPFGIILTPVKGSKFNPFNGSSRLIRFEEGVTRSLKLLPTIQYSDLEQKVPELTEVNLYDDSGEYRVGLVENNDAQNIAYVFNASSPNLVNSFYSNGEYTSSVATVSSYGMSYMVKSVIDPLISTHDPEELTWWDVYRRLPINKFGEILYDYSEQLHQELSKGFRDEVKIKHVLARADVSNSNLLDDDSSVIVTEDSRSHAQDY